MPPPNPSGDRDRELNHVVAEYLKAIDQGQAPPWADWLDAHSQLRPELEEFLTACDTVDSVLLTLRDPRRVHRLAAVHFDNYELLEEIGIGGMSVVYKARQCNPPRMVALKMMSAGRFATAVQRQRFRTEVEAVTRLDHPQIVPVFEVSEAEGRPYFTMKYLNGGNLDKHLPSLRTNPTAVARLLAELARAVHHAHQHGVLHRDLKPSNVVMDDDGRSYLTDFGLARLAEGEDLTKTGELVGTAAYMAPEQAHGRQNAITTATDVHGLGAVLYACLTGAPPFRAGSYVESLERARSYDPPAPRRANSKVPADLDAICLKCLNKEPARRYASAADLADDLDRHLAGRPVRARVTKWPERLVRWARRRPELCGLSAVAAVAVLTLFIGLIVHLQHRADADDDRRINRAAQMRHYSNGTHMASSVLTSGQAADARMHLAHLCDPATAGLREFTWRYLWRQTQFVRRTDVWQGHSGRVWAMALSANGRILASAAADYTIRFWNSQTGRQIACVDLPPCDEMGLDFSPTDDSVYVYLAGKTTKLLEVSIAGALREIAEFPGCGAAQLASDKQSIIVQVRDDDARWRIVAVDIGSGKVSEPLVISHDFDRSVAVSDAGNWIATIGIPAPESSAGPRHEDMARQTIILVHQHTKATRIITDPDGERFRKVAFAPSGKYLAAASSRTVCLFDVASGQRLWRQVVWDKDQEYPYCTIQALGFRQNGDFVVVAGANRYVKALDMLTGTVKTNQQFNRFPTAVVWPADRQGMFVGTEQDPYLYHWTNQPEIVGYARKELLELSDEGWSLAVSRDNRWIIIGTDNQSSPSTVAWARRGLPPKAKPGAAPPKILRQTPVSHDALAAAVASVPGDDRAYSASFDNSVAAWDTAKAKQLWSQPIESADSLRSLAVTPDGHLLAAGDRRGKIHLLDVPTRTSRGVLDGHDGRMVRALRFVSNGRVLASGGHDGKVVLWDMKTMQPTLLANVGSEVHCLAESPDGRVLTASTKSGQLISWDINTHKQTGQIYAHAGFAYTVAYSPDGHTLASGGGDWKVRLWHVASGLPLATLSGHRSAVLAVAFAPDGNTLASTGLDKTLHIWRAESTLP